jgi:hypothetical protein
MADQVATAGGFVPNFHTKMTPNPNRLIRKTTSPPKNGMMVSAVTIANPKAHEILIVNIEIILGQRLSCKD